MKIIKRVSIHRGLARLNDQPRAAPYYQKKFGQQSELAMPIDHQLFKYGFRNKPRSYKTAILAGLVLVTGYTYATLQRRLYENEFRAIYRYRIRQQMNPQILLQIRQLLLTLGMQMVYAKTYYTYQYQLARGTGPNLQQKHVRHKQYKYYQKHRDNRYDFMEIGVLEKFPYHIIQNTDQVKG